MTLAPSITPDLPAQTIQAWKKPKRVDTLAHQSHMSRTAAQSVDVSYRGNVLSSIAPQNDGQTRRGFEAVLLADEKVQTSSDNLDFGDFLDVINPLQHVPVVNMVYRSLTGDEIGATAQIVGGGIFGGPMGALSGVANAIIAHETGKDIAGNIISLLRGGTHEETSKIDYALQNDPESQLELAALSHGLENADQGHTDPTLSAAAMSFAGIKTATQAYEKMESANARTAGWSWQEKAQDPVQYSFDASDLVAQALNTPREEMTEITLNTLPPIY